MLRAAAFALIAACFATPLQAQQASPPATLSLWNRPIAVFRATVNGLPPAERMRNARDRIHEQIADSYGATVATRAAHIGAAEGIVVTIGENIAFGLVPGDLDPEAAQTLEQSAARAAERLQEALNARDQQLRPAVIGRGIGVTLLALVVFAAVTKLILALRSVAVSRIDALLRRRQWAIGGVDIVPTLATVERATFLVISWAVIASLAYATAVVILHAFPYTQPFAERLGEYVASQTVDFGVSAVRAIPELIAVVAVLLMTRAVGLWAARLLAEVEHGVRVVKWPAQEQARATRRIAMGLIWSLGLAIAYSLLPWSGNPVFRGVSLVLGLGASLASAGMVNQWISGLVVLYSRSFRVGDYVRVADSEGIVTEMGPLATKLRSIRAEEITLPNAVMTSDKLLNFTRLEGEVGALLSVSISVGYNVTWRKVQALLLQAAAQTPGLRRDSSARVLQWELTDFNIKYQLHTYLVHADQRTLVRSDLIASILDVFAAAGVQIMTPHFESQPNEPLLPSRDARA